VDQVKNPYLSTVAEHLGLSLAATSRLVNGLVGERLAERWPVSTNRRQMALALTKHGKVTLEKSRSRIKNRLEETLASLPASDLETLLRGVEVVRRVFDSKWVPEITKI
jgi:DNA-binding MarR family transcriptional regulator